MYKKEIGKFLKMYRRQNGFSQDYVANALKTSRQCISSWEMDRTQPNYEMLDALALLYGCSRDALLGERDFVTESILSSQGTDREMFEAYFRMKEVEVVADAYSRCSDAEKDIICKILGVDRSMFRLPS